MTKLEALASRISATGAITAALCALLMMVTMIANVIHRLSGKGSLAGANELVAMLVVTVVFLGFPYAERTETNVRIKLVTSKLPDSAARLVRLFSGVISTLLVAVMASATWEQALVSIDRREFTQGLVDFPIWPTKLVIAIGFSVLTIECFLGVWRRWNVKTDSEAPSEIPEGAPS